MLIVSQLLKESLILWNLKVPNLVHNIPPLFPILSQINPIHSLSSVSLNPCHYFHSIYVYVLFPHISPANCLYFFPSHVPHAPPIITTRLDQLNDVCCAKRFMKLLILYFSLFLLHFLPLWHPIDELPRPENFLYSDAPSFTPTQVNRQY
jgi:hypothetical protein